VKLSPGLILEQARENLIYQDSDDFKMSRIKGIHVKRVSDCMLYRSLGAGYSGEKPKQDHGA